MDNNIENLLDISDDLQEFEKVHEAQSSQNGYFFVRGIYKNTIFLK